jgi:pimeloyl-ACP methyl ester carboxylesterase
MTINGVAAGVPFTALPPAAGGPLVVTWHMLDAPRTNAAFAAALPMAGLPAWRVHLGMPMCGDRMVEGSMAAVVELAGGDSLRAFGDGLTRQAIEEFPSALAAVRAEFGIAEGPVGIVGASLGGLVALRALVGNTPVSAAALVNPLIRIRTLVDLVDKNLGRTYEWDEAAHALADKLDFVKRAAELTMPLLVISGENDHAQFRTDARDLVAAASNARLLEIPGLAHPLADEPGLEPAPQSPTTKLVDDALTEWFTRHVN